jgi:hypothetical protein
MNPESLHGNPHIREYTDYWLAKWHAVGTLSRALAEIDRDGAWRNRTKSPTNQAERLERRVAEVLIRQLRVLGAVEEEK